MTQGGRLRIGLPEGNAVAAGPGDLLLLRGPNGCGKTSLLRTLAGLPAAVRWDVRHPAGDPSRMPARQVAQAVHFVPQDARDGLVGLTLAGEFAMRNLPVPDGWRAEATRDVAKLSSGMARRLALALALAHGRRRVPLLLLDEPAEGLDADGRRALRAAVVSVARGGGIVVAVDHAGVLEGLGGVEARLAPPQPGGAAAWPRLRAAAGGGARAGGREVLAAAALRHWTGHEELQFPPVRLCAGLHCVAGPNGSGKSTWLRLLCGLEGERAVAVRDAPPVPGVNVRLLLPRARALFSQETVRQELGRRPEGADAARLVPEPLMGRHPASLSAGEAQRVALCKVLAAPAAAYLLDEPEAHLDAQGREALDAVLAARVEAGSCVLVATHDEALAAAAETTVRLPEAPASA